MGEIYKITSPSNKSYIGQTIKKTSVRWKEHITEAKRNYGSTALNRAITKYGYSEMRVEILEILESDDPESIDDREIFYISTFNTLAPNGYNLTTGGQGRKGIQFSDETKAKMSEVAKVRTYSRETRQKLSDSAKARVRRPHSEETKKKMSEAKKARDLIEAAKPKVIRKGSVSEETRKKISDTLKARYLSNPVLRNSEGKFVKKI